MLTSAIRLVAIAALTLQGEASQDDDEETGGDGLRSYGFAAVAIAMIALMILVLRSLWGMLLLVVGTGALIPAHLSH